MKRTTLLLSVLLGLAVDILFWNKSQGISFAIFISLLLSFAFYLLHKLSTSRNKYGFYFIIPITAFTILSLIYTEPFISFLNRFTTLLLIGILALGYQSGFWKQFGLIDYLSKGLTLFGHTISVPWLRTNQIAIFNQEENVSNDQKTIKPYLRGLLFALPIIIIFSALFASADLVFENSLTNFLSYLNIENLGEILVRIFIVFFISNVFLGLITFVVLQSKDKKLIGKEKPFLTPFLGMIETTIILISLLVLFITFLIVQFRYFFFNQDAILELGITYSEYARRGFGELITVSVFSLGIILILSLVTIKKNKKEEYLLSSLNTSLVACNLVVLVSSFMRLFLYESAYGFTRLRTYSHVFIIWLGFMLILVAFLIWKHQTRSFTNIAIICFLGFSLTLNILNVDAFIVHQNIKYISADHPLDASYLANLSTDAIPTMVEIYMSESTPQSVKMDVGAALTCFNSINRDSLNNAQWQTFTISKQRASHSLISISSAFEDYEISADEWQTVVEDPDGKTTTCFKEDFPF